jgi:3-oxoacyl-[acyl-carrier-protein] synthase II
MSEAVANVVVTGFGAVRAPSLDTLPEPVRTRAGRAERVTQLVLSAAAPALAMAGLATTDGDPRPRIGVVLGTAFGCFLTNAAYQRRFAEGGPASASPRLFAATVSNAAAGELAIAYRLGGPAVTLTAGTVGGLAAIGHAVDLLRARQADVLVAGGMDAVDAALERWIADGGLPAASPLGEGAAVLVLERADHARLRGARALGIVGDYELAFDPDAGGTAASGFAAAGPFEMIAALERLGPQASETVTGRCPSGHVATMVIERCR